MKILWIVNTPIDILGEKLYGSRANGLWMDALLSDYRKHGGFDLVVATSAKIQKTLRYENAGVTFYAVPDNVPICYSENKPSNLAAWKDLISAERPDLIQVWGTEFAHGFCALKAADTLKIPSVIYMQGYLGSIAQNYLAGMTAREIKRSITPRDILKHDNVLDQQKKYIKASEREVKEFALAGRIICENDWCEESIRKISPGIRVYRCPLSINETFAQKKWDIKNCERHSIICNASGYPLKGLHMLLRAVALLKERYPDIRLYVPGAKVVCGGSFTDVIRKRGYSKYIENLIKSLGIEKNVVWLGSLSQEKLAEQYTKAHVFVLCSSIENHSSSLKEAMIVGVPDVASAVGGVPEYVRHGENGFLYKFEEYGAAAKWVEKIFEDDDLAQKLSKAAREEMIKLHENSNVFEQMLQIYESILEER